jgi:hypothetical protein
VCESERKKKERNSQERQLIDEPIVRARFSSFFLFICYFPNLLSVVCCCCRLLIREKTMLFSSSATAG